MRATTRSSALVYRYLRGASGQTFLPLAMGLVLFAIFAVLVADLGMLMATRRDSQNDVDKITLAAAIELNLDDETELADTQAAIESGANWAAANGLRFDPAQITSPPTNPTVITLDGGGTLTLEVLGADQCFPGSGSTLAAVGVRATLEGRSSPTFLASFVGIDSLTTGATSVACAGRPTEQYGVMPFGVSRASLGLTGSCYVPDGSGGYEPVYGALCDVRVSDPGNGLVGELSIERTASTGPLPDCENPGTGANDLYNNIVGGTLVTCEIGDLVYAKPGVNITKTRDGIRDRLAQEGNCQTSFTGTTPELQAAWNDLEQYLLGVKAKNSSFEGQRMLGDPAAGADDTEGTDDFYEIWAYPGLGAGNPAAALSPYDCEPGTPGHQTSIRNVVLIVINDFSQPDATGSSGQALYEVLDFARLYIEGCTRADTGEFREDCDFGTTSATLTIHGRFAEQATATDVELGIGGEFGQIEVFLKN